MQRDSRCAPTGSEAGVLLCLGQVRAKMQAGLGVFRTGAMNRYPRFVTVSMKTACQAVSKYSSISRMYFLQDLGG